MCSLFLVQRNVCSGIKSFFFCYSTFFVVPVLFVPKDLAYKSCGFIFMKNKTIILPFAYTKKKYTERETNVNKLENL